MMRRYILYIRNPQTGRFRIVSRCGTLGGVLRASALYAELGYTVHHDVA
jgi:hypothetical protein